MCVAQLLLMWNAHTFRMLMLMSSCPSDRSGTPRESPTKLRKKCTTRDANEKARVALLFGISGVVFIKYVMNALTRFGVRGWRQSGHELVCRHEALSDAHRHGMTKDQVQEVGCRDVNLDAAIDFMEKGLRILVNKGDDQVAPVLKNRARHSDRDAHEVVCVAKRYTTRWWSEMGLYDLLVSATNNHSLATTNFLTTNKLSSLLLIRHVQSALFCCDP